MDAPVEFESLRREAASWWYIARRKLLREAVAQALRNKREARVLDLRLYCGIGVCGLPAYSRAERACFASCPRVPSDHGLHDLICTRPEELGFVSNSFDAIVAGDMLQIGAR